MVNVKELKALKKDLKQFKKIMSKDMEQGQIKAEEIIIKARTIKKTLNKEHHQQELNSIEKTIESLKFYKRQTKHILQFKEKWGNKD